MKEFLHIDLSTLHNELNKQSCLPFQMVIAQKQKKLFLESLGFRSSEE